jgi:uncharacterized phage-associated protein
MDGHPYRSVAKSMIATAQIQNVSVTALSLQKLLYFAHGLLLAKYQRALVHETFQAWKYGPVLEPLYHDLKVFGPSAIRQDSLFVNGWEELPSSAEQEKDCVTSILKQLGSFSAGRLVDIAHEPNGPWAKVFGSKTAGVDIPNAEIKEYFVAKLKVA